MRYVMVFTIRYMRYIPLKPQRLYCPWCEETYSLPQNGTIKLYKELRCPLDQFELVLFSLGNTAEAQGKSYPLCPLCYNHPPAFDDFNNNYSKSDKASSQLVDGDELDKQLKIESFIHNDNSNKLNNNQEMKSVIQTIGKEASTESSTEPSKEPSKESSSESETINYLEKMGCNNCLHPTCKQSAMVNGMCPCPGVNTETGVICGGLLILDINSKPNWKLACNQCNTLLRFHGSIHNITPNTYMKCELCGYITANFEFNKLKSPLLEGKTSYSGCIICDDFLNELTEIVIGRSMNLQIVRQIRYKRGSGGARRGSRGRGSRGGGGRGKDVKMSFADF